MTTQGSLSNQTQLQYGFGLFIDELEGLQRIYHSCVVNGFAGHAVYYPVQDMTVVILTNTRSEAFRFIDQQITQSNCKNLLIIQQNESRPNLILP